MDNVNTVNNVTLSRRGSSVGGTLLLYPYHLVFVFQSKGASKEIWICYPIIERISKARGSYWLESSNSTNTSNTFNNRNATVSENSTPLGMDHYSASHIRLQCKDFTYYSFDFINDSVCCEVFQKLSALITKPKAMGDIRLFYAYDYKPNILEEKLTRNGWTLYDPIAEYDRQGLTSQSWRISRINEDYKFSPTYPKVFVVPSSISDNVLKHASKFRSKQRIPVVVYKHRSNPNGNVIARCAQPLVGINLQNRSIQDEKVIVEIFKGQEKERRSKLTEDEYQMQQPNKSLLVDLRPITNAMAQHALGAGTENIDNYRNIQSEDSPDRTYRQVDKIFCNIDNIHVMRESLTKLTTILNDLDKYPILNNTDDIKTTFPLLQQMLTKTQWLHRLSLILQSVDRISKLIHLNNTNVVIHCSDGWDRTSQVSALLQLCLDPYYRTIEGFMILIEKEWVSFGFKFNTRADHGGCIGAIKRQRDEKSDKESELPELESSEVLDSSAGKKVANFFQRAAYHIKNTANQGADGELPEMKGGNNFLGMNLTYGVSSEKSPVFHQFIDCVYQILRQHPTKFEFNSRFLKRLFYHYYSCQYGSFLCDTEQMVDLKKVRESTLSVWDYFNSRPLEFTNKLFAPSGDDDVIFFNFTDVKWWSELYGRSDEEMNGLSNSLDKKFAKMKLDKET